MTGTTLREIRDRKKLSRRDLSVLTGKNGISEQTIYRIEEGRRNPSIKTLEKLAKALGVAVSSLLK